MRNNWVTVRVPGTTSNLGPGFDTFGLALRIYNYVKVRRTDGPGRIQSASRDGSVSPATRTMVDEAAASFFARSKQRAFPFELRLSGEVPVARGLGSSVTVRLGLAAGLNALAGGKLDRQQLLELGAELEHHPDNAAPAVFGGFAVAGPVGRTVRCLHFPVSTRLRFVTLVPRFEVSTEQARRLLPRAYSKADTVHNLNRVALVGVAFASNNYAALAGLFDDRVHQPYREKLNPSMARIIRAGEKAGGIGGWLSGSGSTVICVALENPVAVAEAMQSELPESEVRLLVADNAGLKVL